jgi:cytochrome P450
VGRASRFVYDPYAAEFQERAQEAYRVLRDEHPVYQNPERAFFALSRFEDVWNATLDLASLTTEGLEEARSLRPMLNYLDPPRHDRLRALVSRAFTFRRVAEMEPRVRGVARELLAGFADTGRCDLLAAYAEPLPGRLIAEMIGVPRERRATFLRHTRSMLATNPAKSITDTIREPSERIYEEFDLLLEERRHRRREDLMSALLDAEIEGERLSRDEILGFCYQLIVAGNDTTTTLIGNGAVLLAEHPDQRAALARDPARIPAAVEEMLRYESPAQALPRRARRDFELHGRRIPEGARVLLVFGAANRDEREFEDPDRFDVGRTIRRHLALGHGVHSCLGASLARLEARVAFEELLAQVPEWTLESWPGWITSRWARAHDVVPIAFEPRRRAAAPA